jgi:hypothetical protein
MAQCSLRSDKNLKNYWTFQIMNGYRGGAGWRTFARRECDFPTFACQLVENSSRYKIKEYKQHGEAGSIDLAAVEAERVRMSSILSSYAPQDRWNMDETSLFAM